MKPYGTGFSRFRRWTCSCCWDSKLSRGAEKRSARVEIEEQRVSAGAVQAMRLGWACATTFPDADDSGVHVLTPAGWVSE